MAQILPRHVAIIMDGNGRWAKRRLLPRTAGHKKGVDAVRDLIGLASSMGIAHLTVFAFSSENWSRPDDEVSSLMELFTLALSREAQKLHENQIRLRFMGERSRFNEKLRAQMAEVEQLTAQNHRMSVQVAVNYGGRWDIVQAAQKAAEVASAEGKPITEQSLAQHLSLADLPDPDLLIRTGGESRISNFLLWQSAYAELYFTPVLWPDFDEAAFKAAIDWFLSRERRFGKTSEQIAEQVREAA